MPSPLLTTLTHFWALSEASGNRVNSLGASPDPFVPSGTITKIAGQIAGGGQADQFGTAYGDALSAAGATGVDFSDDFSMGIFVRLPSPVPSSVSIFGRGTWYNRFDFELWSGSGSVSAFLGDGTTTPAVAPFAAPIGSPQPYANGSIVANTWVWIGVRHVVATKTLSFFLGQAQSGTGLQIINRTYTGTIVDSTLPLRINGLDFNAAPHHAAIAVQGAFYAPSALTDKNFLALYNLGQGILPPFVAYATEDAVPSLTTAPRYAYTAGLVQKAIATDYASHGQDTSLSRPLTVQHATTDLQFGWVNAVQRGIEGEAFESAKQASVIIEAAYFVEGDTAATPLTFGGLPSATIAVGGRVYADPIPNRVFFKNQNIRALTYYQAQGGITHIPAPLQFGGASGRRGTGTNTIADINTANYTTDAGQFGFAPTLTKGYLVGPATADRTIGLMGDSIAATSETYPQRLLITSGMPYVPLAVSGARASTLQNAANNTVGATILKDHDIIMDQLGVNDLNLTGRTFAQLQADKTTCWSRWCGAGSAVKALITFTTTPMTQSGSALNMATRETERRAWNAFLRTTGTNADMGAMTGRPTLVYRWNGTAWASSGARSSGTGAALNLFVVDTAAVTENDHIAGDNVWSTSTAGGTKANCSTVAAGDGIHPTDPSETTAIQALLQPQFDAIYALAFDITPPTASSAAVGATGLYIDITTSEDTVLTDTLPADWAVSYGAGNTAVSVTAVSIVSGKIRLTLDEPIYSGDTNVLVSFTGDANSVEDTSGNDLAAFSNLSVSATSAPAAPVAVPPGVIDSTGASLSIPFDASVYRTPTVTLAGHTLTLMTALPGNPVVYSVSPAALQGATPALTVNSAATALDNQSTNAVPTIASGAVSATGLQVILTPSEDGVVIPASLPADWAVSYGVGNTPVNVTAVAIVSGSPDTIALTLASPIYSTDTNVLLSFSGAANSVEDASGNDLAPFSGLSISSAAAPAAPVVVPPGVVDTAGTTLTIPFSANVYRTPTVTLAGFTLTLTTTLPGNPLAYTVAPGLLQGESPVLTVNGSPVALDNQSTATAPPPETEQGITAQTIVLVDRISYIETLAGTQTNLVLTVADGSSLPASGALIVIEDALLNHPRVFTRSGNILSLRQALPAVPTVGSKVAVGNA